MFLVNTWGSSKYETSWKISPTYTFSERKNRPQQAAHTKIDDDDDDDV